MAAAKIRKYDAALIMAKPFDSDDEDSDLSFAAHCRNVEVIAIEPVVVKGKHGFSILYSWVGNDDDTAGDCR